MSLLVRLTLLGCLLTACAPGDDDVQAVALPQPTMDGGRRCSSADFAARDPAGVVTRRLGDWLDHLDTGAHFEDGAIRFTVARPSRVQCARVRAVSDGVRDLFNLECRIPLIASGGEACRA